MMKFSKKIKNQVLKEYNNGSTIKEIKSKYNVSKSTIFYWVKEKTQTKKYIAYDKYESILKEPERVKLMFEIYEKLHCFKDSSILEKEVAISKYFGVYPTKTMCKVLDLPHGTFYNYHFRKKGS